MSAMKPKNPVGPVLAFLCFVTSWSSAVELGAPFRDHAVMQRDQPLAVWGFGQPGEAVTVEFRGHSASAITTADGDWRVRLPALPASAEPAVLRAYGNNTVEVTDVLTGDVWLASGQSNMEWRVEQAADAEREIAAADHPLIRHFDVPNIVAPEPRRTAGGTWVTCSPQTVAKLSAVAYYFAREWQGATDVPVGILNATWGGTPVESWMSAPTLASDPAFQPALARWAQTVADYPAASAAYETDLAAWERADAEVAAQGREARAAWRKANAKPRAPRGPGHHWTPAGLYQGMIAPLVPAAITGVIWYQAESNADWPEDYGVLFPAMIRQWRAEWGRELPFYFVQIANFRGTPTDRTPNQWPWLRDAQARALALPRTGMAVIIDIGTPENIHPKNKQDVGQRLALLARRDLLDSRITATGPVFAGAQREGTALRVTFTAADGLNAGGEALGGFEVAGADRRFHPAEARIDGATVVVTAPAVSEPVAVRYAWRNAPVARLKNGAGLPASPFRSDDWLR